MKTTGTDIDKLMPPVSRFGGSGRAAKKQTVIDKLRAFFEKYFGVGGSSSPEETTDHVVNLYDMPEEEAYRLAAEPSEE